MLYTVVDMLEEKNGQLEAQLASKEAFEEAAAECIRRMDSIERDVKATREMMRNAQKQTAMQDHEKKWSMQQ